MPDKKGGVGACCLCLVKSYIWFQALKVGSRKGGVGLQVAKGAYGAVVPAVVDDGPHLLKIEIGVFEQFAEG